MRKNLILTAGLGAAAALAIAVTMSQSPRLRAFVQALQSAETIQSTLTVQKVGGGSEEYKIALAKPNKARIESATELTVADGETITIYDKKDNTFLKKPQTQDRLLELFQPMHLMSWSPFFDAEAFAKIGASKDGGTRQQGGRTLASIEITGPKGSNMTATLFIDKEDSLLRQAVLNVTESGRPESRVMTVANSMGASDDLFAFAAPAGAKEMSEADIASGTWMDNIEEAKKLAAKFNKTLIGDFYATWCGPCKMLDAQVFSTAEFKKAAKDFILVKIDVDKNPDTTQQYGVSSMPTLIFWTPKHEEIKRFSGFRPLGEFLNEMDSAKNVR